MPHLNELSIWRKYDPPAWHLSSSGESSAARLIAENLRGIETSGSTIWQRIENRNREISSRPHRHLGEAEVEVVSAESRLGAVERALYDAAAQAKTLTSQVAMHLKRGQREWLFARLDDLLDAENWHDDDLPLRASSFYTYLRFITYEPRVKKSSLGISDDGNLLATWAAPEFRLTVEFLPADILRWSVWENVGSSLETAAGHTNLLRISTVLSPYKRPQWYFDAEEDASQAQ